MVTSRARRLPGWRHEPFDGAAACGDRGRRDRRAGGGVLPPGRAGPGDRARGIAAAGRQAVRVRGRPASRSTREPRRCSSPGRREPGSSPRSGWPVTAWSREPRPRRSGRSARSARCPAASSWASRPTWPNWPDRGWCPAKALARASQDLELPPTVRDGDVPVAGTSEPGSARRSSTGWSTRCSAGSTRDVPRTCPSTRRMPALAAASRRYRSLAEAAGSLLPPPSRFRPGPRTGHRRHRSGGPVFTTLAGGLGLLPGLPGQGFGRGGPDRPRWPGRCPRRRPDPGPGWRLTVGSAAAEELIDADAVILAVPARPAGRLLAGVPGASAAVTALGEISYASMAIVTLAYPRSAFPGAGLAALGWSGYLVPAVDGRAVKAVTFSTVKWPHLAGRDGARCRAAGDRALLGRPHRRGGPAAAGR